MASGDVTTYGPYDASSIADIKTELEADSVASTEQFIVAPLDGQFYIIRIE